MRKITAKWLKQAEADLKAAKDSLDGEHYEWSCFQSQQSSEKALKAFLYNMGLTSIMTHSLKELLKECLKFDGSFQMLSTDARTLDMFYIPTEFYEKEDAERCISSAESILKTVKTLLMK